MSNNSYLVNCTLKTANSAEVQAEGAQFKVLSTGANKIPVPWFFCFQEEDLVDVHDEMENSAGEKVIFTYKAPVTEVEKAIQNLKNSKALMIAFCKNEALGLQYWEKAMSDLEGLEYPYLMLDPQEVFYLNDPDEEAKEFIKCFSRDEHAFKSIELLTFYQADALPYELIEFYASKRLSDSARIKNSVSMDMGINSVDTSSWVEPQSDAPEVKIAQQARRPWWKFW